ncbi:MAG: collagen binding domain-containing protein, partial [Planctomycetia bacterium]
VNLWLASSPLAAPALATTVTDLAGGYCFRDLPAGAYRIQVGENQPLLVGLRPDGATTRLPVLVAGQSLLGQDFGYCTVLRSTVAGRVFRESGTQGCDGVYQPDDAPLAGVRVVLAGTSPVRLPVEVLTGADGTYAFMGLEAGAYTVSVDGSQPQLVVLAPGSALSVPLALLEGEVRKQDFPFCGGSICGRVYENDLENGCDGDYDLGDKPLAGVTVGLWFANEGPPAAPRFTTVTGADGRYCFKDLDARGWRVQVVPGQPGLSGLQATIPVVRTPVVLPGGTVEGQDFGYCALLGRIYGIASLNAPCTNDTTLDAGDTRLANVRVLLVRIDGDALTPFEVLTGPDGSYAFEGLLAGTYQVRVEGSDPVLVTLWPATPTVVGPFALPAGGESRVDFGFSQQRAGGIVYRDGACPADGSYGPGDVPLAGVVVEAL